MDEKYDKDLETMRNYFVSIPNLSIHSHFDLHETLGTGTFGRVRLASHPVNGVNTYLAIKGLKKRKIIRLKQEQHIRSEKEILMSVSHPFIVNYYGTFQDEDRIHMIMEFVKGGELFSQLRNLKRFTNDAARFYAVEIILALEHLHERNIVYRDLKPENILIDRDGHVKITDFGFAKHVEDRTWTLCGTPEYLAPEIIQSKGHGKSVDWWALGILIYEMIAGYPPFYDDNELQIYHQILEGNVKFPRYFDLHAKDLVRKLLEVDRSMRLGCLKEGPEGVKTHSWFRDVDWDDVYNRRLDPPFVPPESEEGSTVLFDVYEDSEGSDLEPLNEEEQRSFADFGE